MPCQEVFEAQDKAYKLSVLAPGPPILSVEALSTQGWDKVSRLEHLQSDLLNKCSTRISNLESIGSA